MFFDLLKISVCSRNGLWAYSSAWLERTPDKREVDGSSPSRPTTITFDGSCRGCSSAGRAPALHAGGHRFDPGHLHQSDTFQQLQPMVR